MTDPRAGGDPIWRRNHPRGPNFNIVVISAGVALIVVFIIALIVLAIRGKKDIPLNHTHQDHNARVQWLAPGVGAKAAEAFMPEVVAPVAARDAMRGSQIL
jgi:hypothetical protein